MTTTQNPFTAQDALHAAAQHALDVCEAFDAEFPGWEESVNPERFVSEADYNAATPAEWEGLQTALDWEAFDR